MYLKALKVENVSTFLVSSKKPQELSALLLMMILMVFLVLHIFINAMAIIGFRKQKLMPVIFKAAITVSVSIYGDYINKWELGTG
jgi:cytoskeletal protein RodZ